MVKKLASVYLEYKKASGEAFQAQKIVPVGADVNLVGDISIFFLHNFVELKTKLEAKGVEGLLGKLLAQGGEQRLAIHTHSRHAHSLTPAY